MSEHVVQDPAAELEVLFPDRDVEVRDPDTGDRVTVTVREFRFLEGLRVEASARAFIGALAELVAGGTEDRLELDAITGVMAEHADLWLELIGRACDRPPEWLARLSDADGDALSEAMWSANGVFFTRRVVASAAARIRKAAPSGSERSSTPSSGPDTAADTTTSPGA